MKLVDEAAARRLAERVKALLGDKQDKIENMQAATVTGTTLHITKLSLSGSEPTVSGSELRL